MFRSKETAQILEDKIRAVVHQYENGKWEIESIEGENDYLHEYFQNFLYDGLCEDWPVGAIIKITGTLKYIETKSWTDCGWEYDVHVDAGNDYKEELVCTVVYPEHPQCPDVFIKARNSDKTKEFKFAYTHSENY